MLTILSIKNKSKKTIHIISLQKKLLKIFSVKTRSVILFLQFTVTAIDNRL